MGDTCRLCLVDWATKNIFADDLFKKVLACCDIQMIPGDGLPDRICLNCIAAVEGVHSFKTLCERNDRLLRERLQCGTAPETRPIKEEPPSIKEEPRSEAEFPEVTIAESKKPLRLESNHDKSRVRPKKKSSKNGRKSLKALNHELCPFCGESEFASARQFCEHLWTHSERPYECDTCAKTFKTKQLLLMHVRRHEKKSFQCNICGNLFTCAAYTRQHIAQVHDDDNLVGCPTCGKMVKPSSLYCHMRSHAGAKNYECKVCKQKFVSKNGLQHHARTHTGEKPFRCRFCEKQFADDKSLRDHERLHTGEQPYRCPVCDRGFAQLGNMKSHFRNNHKGVEFVYKRKKPVKNEKN